MLNGKMWFAILLLVLMAVGCDSRTNEAPQEPAAVQEERAAEEPASPEAAEEPAAEEEMTEETAVPEEGTEEGAPAGTEEAAPEAEQPQQ